MISNVNSTTFGLHDLDQRILNYILDQRTKRLERFSKERANSEDQTEITSAYRELVNSIKEDVTIQNAVTNTLLKFLD